jgi:hypothetical protein
MLFWQQRSACAARHAVLCACGHCNMRLLPALASQWERLVDDDLLITSMTISMKYLTCAKLCSWPKMHCLRPGNRRTHPATLHTRSLTELRQTASKKQSGSLIVHEPPTIHLIIPKERNAGPGTHQTYRDSQTPRNLCSQILRRSTRSFWWTTQAE